MTEKQQTKLNKKILITGGGSGGHVSAATGIIDELKRKYDNALENILYIGGKPVSESINVSKSIEQRRFENSDVSFTAIRGGKFQRSFSIKSIKLLLGVFGGIIDAWKEIQKFNPDLIISTGGYVTVPIALVAWLKKIPFYLHEQTAAIGLSNRIASKFAKKIYLTFPQSKKHFPQDKTIQTGNIVRTCTWDTSGNTELTNAIKKMEKIRNETGKPIIYVSGGGQGSHYINTLIRQMLKYLLLEAQIILQTGESLTHKDYEIMHKEHQKLSENLKNSFYPTKFVNSKEIGYLFNKMDIYIGRSGANTVYEMGLLKKPSILIPIPWVTNNEQTKNAQVLVDVGLGKILPQGEATPEKLYNTIIKFIQDYKKGMYSVNEEKLKRTFTNNAANIILNNILYNPND